MPSLALLLFMGALAWALTAPVLSGDLGWQIRAGQRLLDHGDVPRLNFLTFTAPLHPWVAQEWLSGVGLALVDRWAGVGGLLVLRMVLFGGLVAAAWRLCRRLGAEPLATALLMVLVGVQLALHTALRPWLISDLGTVGILALCLGASGDRRWLWALPPTLGLWAQLHGGWVWGALICAAFGLEWALRPREGGPRRRDVALAGLGSVALVAAGPYGAETLLFPLRYLSRDPASGIGLMYDQVKEWAPPELGSLFGILLLIQALLTLAGLWRMRPRSPALALLALAFFYMAARVQRHIPLFVLVSLPPIALGLLAPLRRRIEEGAWPRLRGLSRMEGHPRPALTAALVALALGIGAAVARQPVFARDRLHAHGYPIEAAEGLAALEGGRLLNHYDWGGLLPWLAPGWRVFITPVPDAYDADVFRDWLILANMEPGWEAALEDWDVDAAIFPPGAAIIRALARLPGWSVAWADEYAVLVVRDPAADP